ncbi:MAG: UDP-3-O-[3-hydroxymyristoyl] N-acetylglucosamine deacetylase [Alphaproteobacteria bacterium 43-37]|nr:MAG: UDP-3-O-[3-hydroxymyristoyl] N-acetylglucosamine deacetylase [Alphaproteobacteria bacterium 43-37]
MKKSEGLAGHLQTTIAQPISCQGTGVHSGKAASMLLKPAPADTGIIFNRVDLGRQNAVILANWRHVKNTALCTLLANSDEVSVSTVEHLLAALNGLGIDNLIVDVDGPELPIMDGSAGHFVDLIDTVGIVEQGAFKKILVVQKDIAITDGDRWVKLSPSPIREFSFSCIFDRPVTLDDQYYSFALTPTSFRGEIAGARTFGFVEDVELLQAKGFILGATLDNAIGLSAFGVVNPEGLRFSDECVRHKILDAIGDLALAGLPIMGAFSGHRSGHDLNYQLVKKLMTDETAFSVVQQSDVAISSLEG